MKGKLIVIGSGWGAFRLVQGLNRRNYDVAVVSLRNYFVFTPLLASTAVGTLEYRCIVEPVRYHAPDVEVYEANCKAIDFNNKRITCVSSLSESKETFQLDYDHLVIACGAVTNTFGIKGVGEHALFLKNIEDAKMIRGRVIECFERASQPGVTEQEKWDILHFAVVGGGPTGIEFSAELNDFINEDLSRLYPELTKKVTMTVYDVAPKILSSFDESLSQYALKHFERKGIKVKLKSAIVEVKSDRLVFKNGNFDKFGLLVWSTGLASTDLVKSESFTGVSKEKFRIQTDGYMQVMDKNGQPIPSVYALGDCATMRDYDLPATAQVAKQKAIYLASLLNKVAKNPSAVVTSLSKPFGYKNMGSMAYLGGWSAIVDLKSTNISSSGRLAWLFWRSAYFTMTVSTKNKILIPMFWFLAWVFGRDISRIK